MYAGEHFNLAPIAVGWSTVEWKVDLFVLFH